MKKLATVAVVIAAVSFQNAKAQKIFDKLDRLSDRVDNASNKVDRAGNAVDRAGNTANRAGETGEKIVSLFKKKNQEPAKDAAEDKNKNKPKKIRVMKKNFSKMAMFAAVAVAGFSTLACSKDDDDAGSGAIAKYTVTITGVESSDYVSLAMSGGTDTEIYNQWKVNGTTRSGESAIGLGKADFMGSTKTYVVESSKPLTHIGGSFQIINAGQPLTLSIKIEKDGKILANDNQTLNDGQDYYKQYNF